MTVGQKLLDEIERVSELRGIYSEADDHPRACTCFAVAMMSGAIDRAKQEVQGADPVSAVRALRELESFKA